MEDFVWSMDDNRHTESIAKELTATELPRLMLFAERETILAARASSSGAAEVAKRDSSRAEHYSKEEIRRNRQGLRMDERSSSEVLDVTVFSLGNLARQTIQRQAEQSMLHLIMNQTSHITMLVEGTSLTVNQWSKKNQGAPDRPRSARRSALAFSGSRCCFAWFPRKRDCGAHGSVTRPLATSES